MPNNKLLIKLVKSQFGRKPDHRATVKGLGLRKLNSQVVREDNDCIRGMINKISYLLKVEEVN